jgi:hypothetical protein
MHYPDSIERAFQLASSGKFESIDQIKKQLNREGFDGSRIAGPTLLGQLNKLITTRDDCWKTYLQAKANTSALRAPANGHQSKQPRLRLISNQTS